MATADKSLVPDTTSVSMSHVERLYVQRSLDLQITALERSIKKEIAGSDFVLMREREIAMLRELRARLGARNG